MPQPLPDIVKCAERLLLEVEQAARAFTRYNRYSFGVDLRQHAFTLASLAMRAWREPEQRAAHTDELVRQIDDFQTRLRLGKRLRAFTSFAQFEGLARTTHELGRQAGGWKKQQHRKGQDSTQQRTAAPERAQILSSRAASAEANP